MPRIFQPWIAKKSTCPPSVRAIVIYIDHRLLWRDSHKGVGHALTLDEFVLQNIASITIEVISRKMPLQFFDVPLYLVAKW